MNHKNSRVLLIFIAVLFCAAFATTIKWTDIRSSNRHGSGSYGQASDNTGTSGNVAMYDSSGNLTDGGVAAGNATSVNGVSVPASQSCLGSNSSSQLIAGTCSGGSSADIFSSSKSPGVIGTQVEKNVSVANSATQDLLSTVTAAGYVSEVFVSTNAGCTAAEVIVTVDGEGTPSIDASSIGVFLGNSYMDSLPNWAGRWISGGNNGANQCGGTFRIPIPFASSIKIQIKNNSGSSFQVTSFVVYHTGVSDTWAYTQRLKLVSANVSGITANTETSMVNVSPGKHGRLAALGWIYDGFPGSVSPRTAPLEGAFRIYIDGSGTSSYYTSGSEDIFGMPWYFQHYDSFGTTNSNFLTDAAADVVLMIKTSNTWGAQRVWASDPIVFTSGLKFTWTCGNTSAVSFSGTCSLLSSVYYYVEN